MNKITFGLYRSYIVGFVLSLIFTSVAFWLIIDYISSGGASLSKVLLVSLLTVLAITQLVVQLLFFFHLGKESKPRLNTVSFLFMLMVVGTIGFGSLWIMYNLDYNMMGHEMDELIIKDEKIKPVNHTNH